MPFLEFGNHRINYKLEGPEDGPVVVFVNGLTQNLNLWAAYSTKLAAQGCRVLTYDMIGQGSSSKPVLAIELGSHVTTLVQLFNQLDLSPGYIAGISFGGIIALRFAIDYPKKVKGVVAMSTFSELTPQLTQLGHCLYEGMVLGGLPYLMRLLVPMNLSSGWLGKFMDLAPEAIRRGTLTNDLYAVQNLVESFVDFHPFTDELGKIKCPTLILNGEYDFLTTRECHDVLRRNIPSSRLLIIQHGFHAFTLEFPMVAIRQVGDFVRAVEGGGWQGDKTVWIANDDPDAEVSMFPYAGDHLRMIPVPAKAAKE